MHMHMHMYRYICGFKNSKQNLNMREQQKYENASEIYRSENGSDYKTSLEANDRTGVNQAIRNVIWATL
jgi:hypothetical protein